MPYWHSDACSPQYKDQGSQEKHSIPVLGHRKYKMDLEQLIMPKSKKSDFKNYKSLSKRCRKSRDFPLALGII